MLDGPKYVITYLSVYYDSWRTMAPIPPHRWQNVREEYALKWGVDPSDIHITEVT